MTAAAKRRAARAEINRQIVAAWDGALPLLAENMPLKLARPERGYMKYVISFDPPAGLVLGRADPVPGRVLFTLVVPAGDGMALADRLLEQLGGALANRQTGAGAFTGPHTIIWGDLHNDPGRDPGRDSGDNANRFIGQFWLIEAELIFTIWDAS